MKLNHNQISDLQALLRELTGVDYTAEQAQEVGVAILRFVFAKEFHKYLNNSNQQ